MNLLRPISSIMTKKVITVTPKESLVEVKKIFDSHNIHHLPVVHYKKIVGIISQSDFLYFLHGYVPSALEKLVESNRLKAFCAEDIMTKKMAKVNQDDTIRTALEVFRLNRFHALPVVEEDELIGIVTTFDIIDAIAKEPIQLEDYKTAKA